MSEMDMKNHAIKSNRKNSPESKSPPRVCKQMGFRRRRSGGLSGRISKNWSDFLSHSYKHIVHEFELC
jgi:hypothetical protein